MEKQLKIAIYSGGIPSTTFVENLIKGISQKHKVFLFGKSKSKQHYTSKNMYCFPTFSNKLLNFITTKWRTFLLLLKYPKRFQILRKQVAQCKGFYNKYNWWTRYVPVLLHLPDIFHIQWAKDVEKWIFLKEKLGCKIVLSLRGAHINYSPIADKQLAETYKKYFPKIDAFHAVCDAIGLEAQKYGADSAKIKTIHSLISQDTFELYKIPDTKKIDKLQIISVGRHHWKKGYNLALDACKLLKEQQIPFCYTIIAEGQVPEELLFQRHESELEDKVIFLKALPHKEVLKKIQESDVLLLPSLEEGIANVVLEAMTIGVPVVSSDCGGMSEVVIHLKTGWLVPVMDAKAMSEAIKDVYNSPLERRQEIVINAHEFVKKHFDAEHSIEQFNELYKD